MKLQLLTILLSLIVVSLTAQYDIGSQGAAYLNGGNFGVGTQNPEADIHVKRSAGTAEFMVEKENKAWVMTIVGSAGGGMYWPKDKRLSFVPVASPDNLARESQHCMFFYGQSTDHPGQLVLGLEAPVDDSKFTVNGRIRSEEVQVVNDVEAPDYVFASDYQLRSLDEVENFITENKHLPEIPSAAEFCENGVKLGEMSFDLLKKVEELTLYVIQLNKKIEALETELEKK